MGPFDLGIKEARGNFKLHGHEMRAVRFLRDFEALLFGRLKVACDSFADVGHRFGNSFALRHAPLQAGAFSGIPAVFGIIDKFNFEFPLHLIHRYGDAFFRFEVALESLIHAFGKIARDPNFSALIAGLNKNILKEVKMSFNQPIQRHFSAMQLAAALGAQRIFHSFFSLRVLGSSHFAGSNQWTVMI